MPSNQTVGRSSKRARVGAAIEAWVCKTYGLIPDHSKKADARYKNGTPVEIKGCIHRKSNGRGGTKEGEFFIYEHAHKWLRRSDGYYVFVVYEIGSNGSTVLDVDGMKISIVAKQRRHASKLPYFRFHESGHPGRNNEREKRFKVSDIF
ncbi:hypothetical protein [Natrialbaceae archaeon AArc-T1-2]|uniref:hypothetical protein n=1 Tax=Natrialbaceae archaeon AArc-T1-2 TaxID=3053904 RepID=UPI00255A70FE|nr:hypothetical protein [Natrialbaceae archaeon AArc-T1-2]WIV66566.1 hypothetical protein QQ977_12815 [Natrialbaceae archaeon AArc-T1-2]